MPNDTSSDAPGGIRWVLSRVIPIAFYALLIAFVAVYVVSTDWSSLAGLSLSWGPLLAATALSLAFRYFGVFIWLRLLKRLGGDGLKGHGRELSYIYAKSWLGRYIPGAATWILGKIYFAGRHGVPRDKLAVGGVLEGALQIVATMTLGAALVLFDRRADALAPWVKWAMLATLFASIIVLLPPVFHRLLGLAFRILRRGSPDAAVLPSWSTMGEATGLYVAGALVAGASYHVLVMSVYPDVNIADALYIIGAASLSSAISMLAIFAPGGLGVREGILGLLFAVVMPGPIALVLVVLIRAWSIAVDMLFFVVTWLLRGRDADRAARDRALV